MSAIKELSSQKYWCLLNEGKTFSLLSSPVKVLKIFHNKVCDLQNNNETIQDGLSFLESYLEEKKCGPFRDGEGLWVVHSFYEAGYRWNKLENPFPDSPIAIILEFEKKSSFDPGALTSSKVSIDWTLPNKDEYHKAFAKGLEHLKRGDCYQYNLTYPFHGKVREASLEGLIGALWAKPEQRGEFASFTMIENDFYLSNSPECLFEWDSNGVLESRPIKGTIHLDGLEESEAWKLLQHSEKNESELFMITDLLRNDMNRIDRAVVEVIEKKALLKVPGLIHSYSHLRVQLSQDISLLTVMRSLFPGGSITGAPKIRVMEVLRDLEGDPRGLYCGSTISRRGDKLVGSINIRTAVGNLSEGLMTYHAGGGITFESDGDAEYQEMVDKFLSVSNLLTSSEKRTYQ